MRGYPVKTDAFREKAREKRVLEAKNCYVLMI